MTVQYTPRARRDFDAIFAYLDQRSPQGARNVKRAIVHAIKVLADFPLFASETQERGVYELSVPRHSYKVYYRIAGEEVWIVHIRDTRRRPPF